MDDQRPAFSIAESCTRTTLSRPTIERLISTGKLRSVKIGRRRLIPADALDELLANGVASVGGDRPTEATVAAERSAQGLPPVVDDAAALDAFGAALEGRRTPVREAS